MSIRQIHIVSKDAAWVIEVDGEPQGGPHTSRAAAVAAARRLADVEPADLFIEAGDGEMVPLDDDSNHLAGDEGAPSYW